jgi:hypothetical protein
MRANYSVACAIELSTIEPTTNAAAAAALCNCERFIIASNQWLPIDRRYGLFRLLSK